MDSNIQKASGGLGQDHVVAVGLVVLAVSALDEPCALKVEGGELEAALLGVCILVRAYRAGLPLPQP